MCINKSERVSSAQFERYKTRQHRLISQPASQNAPLQAAKHCIDCREDEIRPILKYVTKQRNATRKNKDIKSENGNKNKQMKHGE